MPKAKIIYQHMAVRLKMPSTQNPKMVYYNPDPKYSTYQARLWNGAFTLHDTREELLESYPHIEHELESVTDEG